MGEPCRRDQGEGRSEEVSDTQGAVAFAFSDAAAHAGRDPSIVAEAGVCLFLLTRIREAKSDGSFIPKAGPQGRKNEALGTGGDGLSDGWGITCEVVADAAGIRWQDLRWFVGVE